MTYKPYLDEYGAKVVWILADGTPSQAQSYYEGNGVTFGWFTNDADNSEGPYSLAGTSMASGVPWVGIIDGTTMEVKYNNPMNITAIVQTLGTD